MTVRDFAGGALSGRIEIATVARIPSIDIIVGLITRLIVGIAAEEAAAARIIIGCRPAAVTNVFKPRITCQIAATAIAVQWRCGMRRAGAYAVIISRKALVAAHHRADAVEQHGPADHTRNRCGRGTEKRPPATTRHGAHRGAGRISSLRITGLWISGLRRRLARIGPWAPHAARPLSARPHRRDRAPRLVASQDRVTHAVQKPAAALGSRGDGLFEFLDAGIGALKRFVLHQ